MVKRKYICIFTCLVLKGQYRKYHGTLNGRTTLNGVQSFRIIMYRIKMGGSV